MDLRSERIKNMAESATLAMAAKARELKQNGVDVISLSLGEPDFKTPKHIQEGAKAAIDEGKYFAYPPVNGYLDLREAISAKFKKENGLNYSPDQIVVSNGAKQSIANVFLALLDPGDEVIVFSPYWVSYSALVELAEGKCVFVNGDLEHDFKATAEQLKASITDKTKALIFSSPCNPTGSVFSQEELEAIAEVLKEYPNIVVISDEIYELINYGEKHVSIGAIAGALTLMDPVAALVTVAIWELMVRTRRHWSRDRQKHLGRDLLDMSRIGLLYGLLLEGFKLL